MPIYADKVNPKRREGSLDVIKEFLNFITEPADFSFKHLRYQKYFSSVYNKAMSQRILTRILIIFNILKLYV